MAALDGVDVLGEHRGGVGCVARVVAVMEEATHGMLEGLFEERALVERSDRPLDLPARNSRPKA